MHRLCIVCIPNFLRGISFGEYQAHLVCRTWHFSQPNLGVFHCGLPSATSIGRIACIAVWWKNCKASAIRKWKISTLQVASFSISSSSLAVHWPLTRNLMEARPDFHECIEHIMMSSHFSGSDDTHWYPMSALLQLSETEMVYGVSSPEKYAKHGEANVSRSSELPLFGACDEFTAGSTGQRMDWITGACIYVTEHTSQTRTLNNLSKQEKTSIELSTNGIGFPKTES